MKPVGIGLLTLLIVSGVSLVGAAQQAPPGNETNVTPGERLSGIIGVQNAEVTGDLENRTFGIKVAQAASNDSRADVAKNKLQKVENRLSSLQDRKQALDRAKDNGTVSNGTYNARVAILAAETANVKQQLNATENATDGLPEELLRSKGINVDAIQMLKNNASNLTGPEVAKIARSIAGPNVGQSIAQNRSPVDIGPPSNVGPANNSNGSGDVNDTERGPPDDTPGPDTNSDNQDNTPDDDDDEADGNGDNRENSGDNNNPY